MIHVRQACHSGILGWGALIRAFPLQAPGAAAASTVISFAQKTFANGNLTSKLHVIELGAAPGLHLWDPSRSSCSGDPRTSLTQLLPFSHSETEMQHAASELAAGAETV